MKKTIKPDNSNIKVDVESVQFLELLFLLFLGLKLAGKIDWSWWWVFAPLWIPLALAGAMIILAVLWIVIFERKKK